MKKIFCALALCATILLSEATAQSIKIADLEKLTQDAVKKAYAASVRCYGYDTVKKQQNSSQFSAVSIKDGYLLTVAHAVVPNQTYKVRFPDGREVIAVALGEITDPARQGTPDMALMKISDDGDFPYAELGWSYSLKKDEPCISIAYPATLDLLKPTVRFGHISNPLDQFGFTVSTCKMEPGDSGGGLFDYMGRVVALHSRINISEDINFEVPVDNYRKSWSSLLKAESRKDMQGEENEVGTDPMAQNILQASFLSNLPSQFQAISDKGQQQLVQIKSLSGTGNRQVNGTVFTYKGRTLVVGKSSEVGTKPEVFQLGKIIKQAKIITRDEETDLVLFELKGRLRHAIPLDKLNDIDTINHHDLGRFLITPLPDKNALVSVISNSLIALPKKLSIGYFGAGATFIKEKITLTRFAPSSPASLVLKMNDHITGINGIPISLPPHYGAELMKYNPGDTITIQGKREGIDFDVKVILTTPPAKSQHPAEHFAGGRSLRSDGFRKVFVHDGTVRPEECGGPVFNSTGSFYGINIARFSRTSSIVMPALQVKRFVEEALKSN